MGYCVIRSDAEKVYGTLCLDTFEELHRGARPGEGALEVMDEHGLTMQVLYPNILGFTGNRIMEIEDEELRNFCVTAYNDACGDLQSRVRGGSSRSACCPSGTSTSPSGSSSAATTSSG